MRRVHCAELPSAGHAEFWIDGDEGHHLVRVLRARTGDRFGVFDGAGREVAAEVLEIGHGKALLRVVSEVDPPSPGRRVSLFTAVPKGKRMEWLVEKCVEAGVREIRTLATARGVRETASSGTLRRWRRAALQAAKQCGRADVPVVYEPTGIAAATEALDAPAFVARPGTADALRDLLPGDAADCALFIGPEGGFDEEESKLLAEAGVRPFGLGPLILRVETAAIVAVHDAAAAG